MFCEKCDYHDCKLENPLYTSWYCPVCCEFFQPSDDHKFYMKLRKNLKLNVEHGYYGWVIQLLYDNKILSEESLPFRSPYDE